MHFLRPNFLYLFIPFVIFAILLIRSSKQTNIWHKICSKDLMPYVLAKKAKRHYIPYLFTLFTLSLLITALAGPSWQMTSLPLIKQQSGLVIVLDLSLSMNAEDIKPSRLQRAIYKVTDILNKRKEGQTALLVFSEDPYLVTPLTDDIATIKALLPVLETKMMPSNGQNVNRAVAKATELLAQAGISKGAILLITSELTGPDMEKTIEIAKQHTVKVFVLGVGTEESTPIRNQKGSFIKDSSGTLVMTTLPKKNLTQLAHSTNGLYVTISLDDQDINDLSKELNAINSASAQEQVELAHNKWHDQGYLFVLLALPFVSLVFRRGMLAMTLLLMPEALQAFSYSDLWKTADQQAEQLFHQEEYQQAKDLFQNQDWQAAANYKLGEYETAAQLFQDNHSAEGLFNYGTARAKLGDYEEALDAYNKALAIQADHEDALYNKKVIEDFQKRQEQNESDKNDQKSEQQKKNEDRQDQQDQNQEQNQESAQNQDQSQDQQKKQDQEHAQDKSQHENQNDQKGMDQKQIEGLDDQYRDKMDNEIQAEKESQQEISQIEESSQDHSQRQIDDRWLERIQDDPGGLLRRKFLQQYRQHKREQ